MKSINLSQFNTNLSNHWMCFQLDCDHHENQKVSLAPIPPKKERKIDKEVTNNIIGLMDRI